jgi:hypothetical protein
MNAVHLTRLTMIVATLAAAVTVQAAPVEPVTQVVTLPTVTVTVIGKREPVAQVAVVTLPTVTVIGKRAASGSVPTVVAQKAPLKTAAPV